MEIKSHYCKLVIYDTFFREDLMIFCLICFHQFTLSITHITQQNINFTGPDSLVVRPSASGSEGRGFAPWPRHTKGVKNGTGSSLTDPRNKRVVLGRYKNAGRYLLLVMSQ